MRSRFEKRCQKELEKKGYMVDWKLRPSRPMTSYATDFFHLGDLLAVKKDELRFISVKGKSCPKAHKEDLQEFARIIPKEVSVELWRYDREPKDKRKIRRRITKYER